jgi:transcriptional regulator with XRE-family HTH domain
MDLKEIVAANVRQLRHAKNLTQEDLAERVGLSPRYIGSVERGTSSPTVSVLGKLATALNVEPSVLVTKRKRG